MPLPPEFINVAVGLLAAVGGSGVTGYFTLKAADKAISLENEKEERQAAKEVQNMLDALGVEISTIWDFHMRRIGNRVENLAEGDIMDLYYPLTQNYFTIYDSNAWKIGAIRDARLRQAIVICYNKCKKVVDAFKYNNELLAEMRKLAQKKNVSYTSLTNGESYIMKTLAGLAKIIKEDHVELKGYVENLMCLLSECRMDDSNKIAA